MVRLVRAFAFAAALAIVARGASPVPLNAAPADPFLTETLDRVSAKVLDYYQHAQSIVATETVRMEQLGDGLRPSGPPRRLIYDLRVEWSTPASPDSRPEPEVVRRLLSVNGSAPKASDEPSCEDPGFKVTPEPLFMLLPEHRLEYGFSLARPQTVDNRPTTIIDYISLPVGSGKATWDKDCVSIPLEGKTRGRIWVDAVSDVVLKLEEHLVGMLEVPVPRNYARGNGQNWMNLERSDYSVQYKSVQFTDPDETVVLPSSVETLRVFRGSGVSRLRVTQTYSGYQRFLTKTRMLPPPPVEKP